VKSSKERSFVGGGGGGLSHWMQPNGLGDGSPQGETWGFSRGRKEGLPRPKREARTPEGGPRPKTKRSRPWFCVQSEGVLRGNSWNQNDEVATILYRKGGKVWDGKIPTVGTFETMARKKGGRIPETTSTWELGGVGRGACGSRVLRTGRGVFPKTRKTSLFSSAEKRGEKSSSGGNGRRGTPSGGP